MKKDKRSFKVYNVFREDRVTGFPYTTMASSLEELVYRLTDTSKRVRDVTFIIEDPFTGTRIDTANIDWGEVRDNG